MENYTLVEPCGCNEGRGCGQWVYTIRDSNDDVIDGGGEYATEDEAEAEAETHLREISHERL